MPRRKRKPTIAEDLQAVTRQLAALAERVREAEAVKNAVDAVMKSTVSRPAGAVTAAGKRRGRPPGSKNRPKPANGRRKRGRPARSTAKAAPSNGRRRPGRPRKTGEAAAMG